MAERGAASDTVTAGVVRALRSNQHLAHCRQIMMQYGSDRL